MSNEIVFGIKFKADGKDFVGEARVARDAIKGIGDGADAASGSAKKFGQASEEAANRAGNSFGKARAGVQSISEQLNRLQNIALSFVGFSQFVRFTGSLIDTSVALDGFNAKMAIATGSAKNAGAEYEYMRQLSNRLGMEINSTADAYSSFASAARGTALEGAKAREVFTGVAAASARMSLTADAQSGVFLALSQMMSKGVVSAEEFRQQLGERLPIATTAAAAALNVTTAEFVELLNSGSLVSEEFLPKFAAQLEKMAGGGGSVDNMQASLNRLSSKFTEFKQGIDVAPLKSAIDALTDNFDGLAAAAGKLLTGTALVAGGYALGAAIAFIGISAAASAGSVALLNADMLLFMGGAALQKLETLGMAGKGGLLGLALWGGYEIGEFLNRNTQIQKSVQEVLDPIFRFFDRSDGTMLSKLQEKLEELKSGKPIRGALRFDQNITDKERAAMIADTERQIAALRQSLGMVPAAAAAAAAPAVAAAGQVSKAWEDAYQTQAQKKASEVAELDTLYLAETEKFRGNQEMLLQLAEGYAEKHAQIDKQFAEKAKADPAADAAKRAIEAEGNAYANLTKSVTAHIAVLGVSAGAETKLTESQKKLVELSATYKTGLTEQNEADQQAYIASLAQAAGMELAADASDAAGKAAERHAAEEKKRIDALNQSVTADQQSLDAMTRRNDLLEMGIVSVEQMALAELQLQAAMLDSATVTTEEAIALQKRIDIAEKMIEQANRGEHIQGLKSEAKAASEAWKKSCEEINRTLTDALMRGWENGKGFAANFRDTVKNMFKTLVLQPTISAIMSPVSAAISAGMGALGIPGMANAAGMGSNLLGLGSSIAGFGSAVATGFGLSASAATTAASAYSAAGMSATSFGLQLGNLAAAIPGWGWAIAGGMALVGLLGNKGTPTRSTGHAVIDYDPAGKQTGYQSQYGVSNAGTDAIVAGMNASYLKIAKDLGIGAVDTQFGYASNTGKNGKQPMFGLHGGAAGGPMFGQAETVYSEAAMGEAASRAVFAALQGSQLPGYLKGVFEGLDASKMSGQDISNTLAFAASLKSVRSGLTETITPISTAQDALDGLGTTAATFTKDFVAAIDKGMTPEQLAKWQTAGAALGQLGDMSFKLGAAIPQVEQSSWQMWQTQTDSVRKLISTFDGSVAATHALSTATKDRYATEQQLVNQISSSMANLNTMFAGSAEQMSLSVMTAQQKNTYFTDQANHWSSLLMTATDPAKIEEYATKFNTAQKNAWDSMDDPQRKAMLPDYLAENKDVNDFVQEKLGKTLDDIGTVSGTDLPAQIATAIETAMKKAAADQQAAADKNVSAAEKQTEAAAAFQAAANTLQAAANTPARVDVDVDFHANVPGATQVGVL